MTRIKVLVVLCFVAAFAAGTTTGLVARRPPERHDHRSWLMAELNLSDPQREQMRKIWSEVMEASGRQSWDRRKVIAEERDQAIDAMLTGEQQPRHKQILAEYERKMGELSQQRQRAFEEAVERTKQMLSPEQAKQYDEMMKKHRERGFGGPGGKGRPPWSGHRRPDSGPRSRPSTQEHRPPQRGE